MAKEKQQKKETIKIPKPKNDTELNALIGELGTVVRNIITRRAEQAEAITPIVERYQNLIEPLTDRQKALIDSIDEYANKHRARLTQQEACKTVNLPSGNIKWYFASKWRTILPEGFSVREFRRWLTKKGFGREKIRKLFQHYEPSLKKDEAARHREELELLGSSITFQQSEFFQILPTELEGLKDPVLNDLSRCLTPSDE